MLFLYENSFLKKGVSSYIKDDINASRLLKSKIDTPYGSLSSILHDDLHR